MTTHIAGEADPTPTPTPNWSPASNGSRSPAGCCWIRVIIGSATFFDAYTVLVIAFAMPQLVKEWSLSPAEVGLHPVRRLRRPTHRRDRLRLARREDRPPPHPADHHRAVRLDGRRLPVRLERRLDDAVPVLPGHRHRRRGPRRLRLHQRVHRRQEARPVLPALRADLPDRPAVRRYLRLLPGPALRLEGAVHRRPRPGADHDPAAGPDARVPALAGLQGPHRQGRQGRLHAGERSGQGRQAPARTGHPPGRPQGHREVRLAGTVQGHLPQAHPDDLGACGSPSTRSTTA